MKFEGVRVAQTYFEGLVAPGEADALYAEQICAARSYSWDAEEQVGHAAFFARDSHEVDRVVRMLAAVRAEAAVDKLREAEALIRGAAALLAYARAHDDQVLVAERSGPDVRS